MSFWNFSDQIDFSFFFEKEDASEFRTHKVFRSGPDQSSPKSCFGASRQFGPKLDPIVLTLFLMIYSLFIKYLSMVVENGGVKVGR